MSDPIREALEAAKAALAQYGNPDFYLFLLSGIGINTDPVAKARAATIQITAAMALLDKPHPDTERGLEASAVGIIAWAVDECRFQDIPPTDSALVRVIRERAAIDQARGAA